MKVVHLNSQFWQNNFLKLAKRVRLKSNDLLVLAFAYAFKPDLFITFDKNLQAAYIKTKSL